MSIYDRPRAKKGGEMGVNGEFYEGGKFLPSTDKLKRRGSYKSQGKKEIAPYVWEVPPAEGYVSIFGRWRELIDKKTEKPLEKPCEYYGVDPDAVEEYYLMWKVGYRWVLESEPWQPCFNRFREEIVLMQGEEHDPEDY